jgi:hypothetical protein
VPESKFERGQSHSSSESKKAKERKKKEKGKERKKKKEKKEKEKKDKKEEKKKKRKRIRKAIIGGVVRPEKDRWVHGPGRGSVGKHRSRVPTGRNPMEPQPRAGAEIKNKVPN